MKYFTARRKRLVNYSLVSLLKSSKEMQMKTLGTLALATLISLSAASARADAWLLDIVQVQAGSNGSRADSYLAALNYVAKRHGGVQVSRFRENVPADEKGTRLVGLWKFPTPQAVDALIADPAYSAIRRLRQTTIDAEPIPPLQLVADRALLDTATR